MRVGSLFAGIGGFDIAAERAGMTVAWQSENDLKASAVLAHHWPDVPTFGDIHGIAEPPAVDVLTGGFPCQDYSVAGTRGGLAGDRGALWWEFHRLIVESRPTWVVGENVPGLLSSRGGADFETIVGSLTECGYGVAWAVLDAQYFGVAQRRRRVFVVGHSGGEPRPEILSLSEGVFGHPEPSREAGQGVAGSLGTRAGSDLDYHATGGFIGPSDGALAFNWQSGGDVRLGIKEEHTDALHSSQTPAVVRTAQTSANGVGVLTDGTVHNLDAAGPEALVTGNQVRRLTPLECERLQGFPDGWTDIPGNSDTQRYRQLGNAVAVPVAEWIMRRLV